MSREKMIFCRVTWMKFYQGITDSDQPARGGAYVKENNNAHESENFRPYNHICHGYFKYSGTTMNLERIVEMGKAPDRLDGVTVVWVSTAPDRNQYIVGWYKNASVYRRYQWLLEPTRHDGDYQGYWIEAKESDCVLIPEDDRRFLVPNAVVDGAGMGMGQSNIWYADAEEAKPYREKALRYIRDYSGPTSKFYYTAEELDACAKDKGQSIEELTELWENASTSYLALKYANLAVKKEYSYDTLMLRAISLRELSCMDEEAETLRRALYEEPNDVAALLELQEAEMFRRSSAVSIEAGRKLLKLLDEGEDKAQTVLRMAETYLNDHMPDEAATLMRQYNDLLRKHYEDTAISSFWEDIRNQQETAKQGESG